MVNTCDVQGCVVGKAKQNLTLHERAGKTPVMAAFRIDDSKPLGADASLPCVQSTLHFS